MAASATFGTGLFGTSKFNTLTNTTADTLTLADGLAKKVTDINAESLTLDDGLALKVTDVNNDTLALADSLAAKASLSINEAVNLLDSLAATAKLIAADASGLGDSFTQGTSLQLQDTLSLSDSIISLIRAVFGDTATITELLAIAADLGTFPDAATLSDALSLKPRLPQDEASLGTSDGVTASIKPSYNEAAILADAQIAVVSAVLNDILALTDNIANRVTAINSDSTTATDAYALAIDSLASDTLALSDTLTNIKLGHPLPSPSATFDTGTFGNSIFDGVTGDPVTLLDSINFSIGLGYLANDLLSISDAIQASVDAILADNAALADGTAIKVTDVNDDALTLADGTAAGTGTVDDEALGVADSISPVFKPETMVDALTLSDQLLQAVAKVLQSSLSVSDNYDHADVGKVSSNPAAFDVGIFGASEFDNDGDYLGIIDSISRKFSLTSEDAAALAELLSNKPQKPQDESASLADTIAVKLGLNVDEAIGLLDDLRADNDSWLTDAAGALDDYSRKIGMVLGTPAVFDSGQFDRTTFDNPATENGVDLAEQLAFLFGMSKNEAETLIDVLSMELGKPVDEAMILSDNVVTMLTLRQTLNDLLSLADAMSLALQKLYDEVALVTDAYYFQVDKAINEAIATAELLGIKTQRPLTTDGVGLIDELFLRYALGIGDDFLVLGTDTIRGRIKTLLQQVFINGVSVPVTGLTVQHSARDRVSTVRFKISSPSVEVLNLAKQRAEVNVYLVDGTGNTDYFSGRIVGNPTAARSTITTEMAVTVDDWTAAAHDTYVTEVYTDSITLTDILKALWLKYYGYTIDLSQVVASDKTVPLIAFNYDTLFEATEKIAQLLGWVWFVDWDGGSKVLKFYPPSVAIKPITLSRENRNIAAGTARFGQDDRLANSLYLFGGQGMSSPYTQRIAANGTDMIYKLTSKPHRLGDGDNGGITVNVINPTGPVTTAQTVGIKNLHDPAAYDVLLDFNDATLTWRSDNKPPADYFIEPTYKYTYPIMVHVTDDASIAAFGKIEKVITDTKVKDSTTARETARALIKDYAWPKGYGSCEVFIPGLRAGEFITVDLPAYGVSGLFELTEVEKWIQGNTVRRRVTLNVADDPENRIAQRLKEFAKRISLLESDLRPENLVVQRMLQGPANVKVSAVGKVAGSIKDTVADTGAANDEYVAVWKTEGQAKAYAADNANAGDLVAVASKPSKADTAAASEKVKGGITFFDQHTFGDALHPFGFEF